MNRVKSLFRVAHCYARMQQSAVQRRSITFKLDFFNKKPMESRVALREEFFESKEEIPKDKKTFNEIIERFKDGNPSRKGHVEFITTALKHMKEFGVEGDMEVYRSLFSLFPKGKFVPKTLIQAAFFHHPFHQDTAVAMLEKMSRNGLIPDRKFRKEVIEVFGYESYVFQKVCRMRYWGSKMRHQNPYPVPFPTPKNPKYLAELGMQRMLLEVDRQNTTTVYEPEDLPESALDKTWIVSNQCPTQQRLIAELPDDAIVSVEGPSIMWMREQAVTYFTLVAPPRPMEEITVNADEVDKISLWQFGEERTDRLDELPTVHEQEDGVVLATVATGSSSRDSLLSWIRLLQKSNPRLGELPVVFKLRAPSTDLVLISSNCAKLDQFQEGLIEEAAAAR